MVRNEDFKLLRFIKKAIHLLEMEIQKLEEEKLVENGKQLEKQIDNLTPTSLFYKQRLFIKKVFR